MFGAEGLPAIFEHKGGIGAEHGAIRQAEACGAVKDPQAGLAAGEGHAQLDEQATVAAARFPSGWRHDDEKTFSRELQHRLRIELADPLELLRRQPQIPGQQQRRRLQPRRRCC